MNYMKQKNLIQEYIVPSMIDKLSISDSMITLSLENTMKLFLNLKQTLPSQYYFLYEELRGDYCKQVAENYSQKNYTSPFSIMPFARRHGLVKQLKRVPVYDTTKKL